MSSPETTPTSRQAVRRKLLGGAFSAPAVLTLYSGNALATGSSLRCLAYQANSAPTTQGVLSTNGGLDVWVRVPLYPMTSNAARFWIKGSDVFAKWLPARQKSTWGIQSNQYQEFNPATNQLMPAGPQSGDPGLGSANKWASLRFDAAGNIMGVGTSGSGSAMPGTCWASAVSFI